MKNIKLLKSRTKLRKCNTKYINAMYTSFLLMRLKNVYRLYTLQNTFSLLREMFKQDTVKEKNEKPVRRD